MTRGALRSGDVLSDRYRLEERAGAGGMGVVHRAVDLQTGTVVALKTLHETDPQIVSRFEREGEVLRQLSAPGIVRCLDHGVTREGDLYLVMEWLEGEPLSARLSRGPLPLRETLLLARGVAQRSASRTRAASSTATSSPRTSSSSRGTWRA